MGLTCGAQNNYVSEFENDLASFATHNSVRSLSEAASRRSDLSAEQPTRIYQNLCHATLTVLNINALSIKAQDKLDQFHVMLDQWLPCKESWLTSEVYNAEIIPDSLGYTMFSGIGGLGVEESSSLFKICILQIGNRIGKQTVKYYESSFNLQGLYPSTLLFITNQMSLNHRASKSLESQSRGCQLLRAYMDIGRL